MQQTKKMLEQQEKRRKGKKQMLPMKEIKIYHFMREITEQRFKKKWIELQSSTMVPEGNDSNFSVDLFSKIIL